MNLLWGTLIVVAATIVTVGAMLLVRRSAPEGSYFSDGDRASGVFGVLATGFSVLLGFIIFLSFSSRAPQEGAATPAETARTRTRAIIFATRTMRTPFELRTGRETPGAPG